MFLMSRVHFLQAQRQLDTISTIGENNALSRNAILIKVEQNFIRAHSIFVCAPLIQ